jgi:hypothetical protein
MNTALPHHKFPLGQIVATPGVIASVPHAEMMQALNRHGRGDWGDLDAEDIQENELSLRQGFRLLSAYTSTADVRFWIITEADRASTTFLLPEEY